MKVKIKENILKPLGNESGMTLVIVIVLAAVALVIMSGLIYMVTSGTQVSGMGKRYATVTEAAVGGVDVGKEFIDTMSPSITDGLTQQINPANVFNISANAVFNPNLQCLSAKLKDDTSQWSQVTGCNGNFSSFTIDPNVANSYDMQVTLGTYTVYAKIVDTVQGNTAGVPGLVQTGVVHESGNSQPAKHYMYTVESLSCSQPGCPSGSERSKVSAVYEY